MLNQLKDTLAKQNRNTSKFLRKDTHSTVIEEMEEEDNISICGFSRRNSRMAKIGGIKITKIEAKPLNEFTPPNKDLNFSAEVPGIGSGSILNLKRCEKGAPVEADESDDSDDFFYGQKRAKSKSELNVLTKGSGQKQHSYINLVQTGLSPILKKTSSKKIKESKLCEEEDHEDDDPNPYISDFSTNKGRFKFSQRPKAHSLKKKRPSRGDSTRIASNKIQSREQPSEPQSSKDLITRLYDNGFKNYKMKVKPKEKPAQSSPKNVVRAKIFKMLPKTCGENESAINMRVASPKSVKSNLRTSERVSQNSDLEGILGTTDKKEENHANVTDKFSHKIALILHQKMREEHFLDAKKNRVKSQTQVTQPAQSLAIEQIDQAVISQKFQELFGDILNISKSDELKKRRDKSKDQAKNEKKLSNPKIKKNMKIRKIAKQNLQQQKLPSINKNVKARIGSNLKVPRALQERRKENSSVPIQARKRLEDTDSIIKLNRIETISDTNMSIIGSK